MDRACRSKRGGPQARTGRGKWSRGTTTIGEDEAVVPSRYPEYTPHAPLSDFVIGRFDTERDVPVHNVSWAEGVGEASGQV